MEELQVSCQVSCQKCGWHTGATLFTDEANALEAVLNFIKGCSCQHSGTRLSGELLVSWKPLESGGH
jgi:hypothetical protein